MQHQPFFQSGDFHVGNKTQNLDKKIYIKTIKKPIKM